VGASLRAVLESLDLEITTAVSAAQAMDEVRQRAFDLVITDLRLTGPESTEGLDLIPRIKRLRPATDVVLFTAFGTPEILRDAVRRGATAAWEKSLPIPELILRIRGLVSA
jgi:DNA-binding NtrC family response regulator